MLTKGKLEQRFSFASPPVQIELEETACQIKEAFLGSGFLYTALGLSIVCLQIEQNLSAATRNKSCVSLRPAFHGDLQDRELHLGALVSLSALFDCMSSQTKSFLPSTKTDICFLLNFSHIIFTPNCNSGQERSFQLLCNDANVLLLFVIIGSGPSWVFATTKLFPLTRW